MSKNYDNWERLVGAVLRRESDRQFAYILSWSDSSSISASTLDLSFNSIARFDDDDDVGIGMSNNYNDVLEKVYRVVLHRELGEMQIAQLNPLPLMFERIQLSDLLTLHHSDWKTMLLPHQQQIVFRPASLIFFPYTSGWNGENCFLVGSKNIEDLFKHSPFKSYQKSKRISNPKSRFSEVLEIYRQESLNVGCRINTQMLSPDTLYAAYLVFALIEEYPLGKPLAAISTLNKSVSRMVYFETGNDRSDGWMEVKLGDFYVYPGKDREVQVGLMCKDEVEVDINIRTSISLEIEGIEFRPSKDDEYFSKFNKSDDDDDRASPHTQKAQLLIIRTGNNSLMLGARALLISYEDNPWCWKWTTHDHSRFAEVVELKNVWWLKIRGKIKTRMLSPKTDYAAFLVFNLADGCKGLEQAKRMVRFPDNESEYDAEKGAHILNLLIAVSRSDGWMEIKIGNFYVDDGNEREVEAQLFEFKSNLKSGLIVEGIEFRPV